jgi:hypothetical protein
MKRITRKRGGGRGKKGKDKKGKKDTRKAGDLEEPATVKASDWTEPAVGIAVDAFYDYVRTQNTKKVSFVRKQYDKTDFPGIPEKYMNAVKAKKIESIKFGTTFLEGMRNLFLNSDIKFTNIILQGSGAGLHTKADIIADITSKNNLMNGKFGVSVKATKDATKANTTEGTAFTSGIAFLNKETQLEDEDIHKLMEQESSFELTPENQAVFRAFKNAFLPPSDDPEYHRTVKLRSRSFANYDNGVEEDSQSGSDYSERSTPPDDSQGSSMDSDSPNSQLSAEGKGPLMVPVRYLADEQVWLRQLDADRAGLTGITKNSDREHKTAERALAKQIFSIGKDGEMNLSWQYSLLLSVINPNLARALYQIVYSLLTTVYMVEFDGISVTPLNFTVQHNTKQMIGVKYKNLNGGFPFIFYDRSKYTGANRKLFFVLIVIHENRDANAFQLEKFEKSGDATSGAQLQYQVFAKYKYSPEYKAERVLNGELETVENQVARIKRLLEEHQHCLLHTMDEVKQAFWVSYAPRTGAGSDAARGK